MSMLSPVVVHRHRTSEIDTVHRILKMTKDHLLVEEPMDVSSTPFSMSSKIADTSNYYEIKLEKYIADYDKDVESWYMELVERLLNHRIDVNVRDALSQAPLHIAVRHQHPEMVVHLLSNGAIVDVTDLQGRTPLHVAASLGSGELAELLLRHGADHRAKSHDGFTILFFAVQSGCADLVRLLVERGCDVNELVADRDLDRRYSYLHSAVERNNVKMVETLLTCKADVNQRDCYGRTCLHVASREGRLEIVERLLTHGALIHERDRNGQTALCLAVDAGHQRVFQLLINHGADVNDKGSAGSGLLHLAVRQTDLSLLASLLSRGADVDAATRFGRTALHCAVAERNRAALELLLRHGADVNRRENLGKTPLHLAVEARRQEVLELLLRHGADTDARDNGRQTPLHAAIRQGCATSVETLLRHGADANALDDARQTPLHLAVRSGYVQLLEPLARHGADLDAADAEGRSPLHLAIAAEHSRLVYVHPEHTFVAALLSRGADVDAGPEAPLRLAVAKRCPAFVRALLLRGADPHARGHGRTALHAAAENRDADCLEQLLAFGADAESRDEAGRRAELARPELLAASSRQLVRRSAAGLGPSASIKEKGESREEYRKQCEEEVRRMAATRLHEDATYLDLLRGGRRSLVVLARYPPVVEAFEAQTYRKAFPIYADLLERNYRLGRRFEAVLEPAAARLEAVCRHRLPDLPLDEVLGYLNVADMRNLLKAVPSLPVRFEGDES